MSILQRNNKILKIIGGDDWQPDLILDDGGDATHLLVNKCPAVVKLIRGVVECSVTGVHRLYQLSRSQKLTAPAMNIHDAVTCTMFNNYYAPKESIVDAVKVRNIVITAFV